MSAVADALRGPTALFVAAMLQAVVVSSFVFRGGAPDVLLVTVVSLGLLRGSIAGAVYGFAGGLVVDLLTLETLGITSIVLTLAGFWAGRYAETTAQGRKLAPLLAVGSLTLLAAAFSFGLHYLLGEEVVATHALLTVLVPTLIANLALALPVYRLLRSLVPEHVRIERAPEVEVVV